MGLEMEMTIAPEESTLGFSLGSPEQEGEATTSVSLPEEIAESLALEPPGEANLVEPDLAFEIDTVGEIASEPSVHLPSEPPFAENTFDLPPAPFDTPDRPFGLDEFDDFDPFGGGPLPGDPFAGW